jgi:hypothetical protein
LELANGGRIVSLPGNNPGNIRSFSRVRLLLVDEAAYVRDTLLPAVRPMLARSGGWLVMASTPFGARGSFWEAWDKGTDWRRTMVKADMVPQFIPPDFLAAERKALGDRWWRQEYFCTFEAAFDQVFDSQLIEQALERGQRLQPLFGGVA